MLYRLLLLLLGPASALNSKGRASVSERGSLSVETSHTWSPKDFVVASGKGRKGEAEKAYARAIEDAKQAGYGKVKIQMFSRYLPTAKKTSSSLLETKTKAEAIWPWDKKEEQTPKVANGAGPHDIIIDMDIPVVPTDSQEYVIISDKGPDGKPITEEQRNQQIADLAKTSPHAKAISGAEADKMMGGLFDKVFGPGFSPFSSGGFDIAVPSVFDKVDMGRPMQGSGGVTKTTTVCENGKCTRTEEYSDPSWKGASQQTAPEGGDMQETQLDKSWSEPQRVEEPPPQEPQEPQAALEPDATEDSQQ